LTEALIGSQLFGHRRGAFTGAVENHEGVFEAAQGGTLFLDEVGDIPLGIQASLLRVLQEREITRLGESKPRKIDVRVLTATHRDLGDEVEAGRFRQDLLYRIRIARIELPALQERREDIPLLVAAFLRKCRALIGKDVREISPESMQMLMAYEWPGNVRELANAVEFAVVRSSGPVLHPDDLPPELKQAPTPVIQSVDSSFIYTNRMTANAWSLPLDRPRAIVPTLPVCWGLAELPFIGA
jgi:DNA-binding NtrC family response regulator